MIYRLFLSASRRVEDIGKGETQNLFDELLEIVKEFFKKLFSSRLFALSVIFTVMFAGLLGKAVPDADSGRK